ncbi:MAG: helix-turn-helix domain-containing protein [Roseburia sp.]|nr:helix-turn-helix domain-containing protein [Roseburia sp.]
MDALTDLKRLLCDIKEKTGTEVRLSPKGGEETQFTLEFCGEKIDAYLEGSGESIRQTAELVRYLTVNADMLRPAPEKEEYLKNILLGEGGEWYAFRFLSKYNLGDAPCFAVSVQEEKKLDETVAHLERCVADSRDMAVKMDGDRCAVVKFCEEGQSPYDFAQFLSQSLYEEIGVKASVGVGCEVKSFTEISASYRQAITAVRMSGLFHSKGEVHSYKEYLLVKMLEDVPEARLKDYLEQLQIGDAAEVFEDDDMLGTAEEFLENSLNISETSRNLYMHRNTLMYRLDKIERITGLNIRKFSDAVSFRVITILYKLMQL